MDNTLVCTANNSVRLHARISMMQSQSSKLERMESLSFIGNRSMICKQSIGQNGDSDLLCGIVTTLGR